MPLWNEKKESEVYCYNSSEESAMKLQEAHPLRLWKKMVWVGGMVDQWSGGADGGNWDTILMIVSQLLIHAHNVIILKGCGARQM